MYDCKELKWNFIGSYHVQLCWWNLSHLIHIWIQLCARFALVINLSALLTFILQRKFILYSALKLLISSINCSPQSIWAYLSQQCLVQITSTDHSSLSTCFLDLSIGMTSQNAVLDVLKYDYSKWQYIDLVTLCIIKKFFFVFCISFLRAPKQKCHLLEQIL